MIKMRYVLLFVGWLACLAAIFFGVTKFPAPYGEIAVFSAWSLFLVFAMLSMMMAMLPKTDNHAIWLGIAIFSIGPTIVISFADGMNNRTAGTIIADVIFNDLPFPPPTISSELQPPPPTTSDAYYK